MLIANACYSYVKCIYEQKIYNNAKCNSNTCMGGLCDTVFIWVCVGGDGQKWEL